MIRKSILHILAMTLVLSMATTQCYALIGLQEVTPELAKELGVVVRSKRTSQNSVYVWLEFKPEGKLKDFRHAQLSMESGDRSLTVSMRPLEQTDQRVELFFSADPQTMPEFNVMVVVGGGGARSGGVGYLFKMKAHVDAEVLKEQDKPEQDKGKQDKVK